MPRAPRTGCRPTPRRNPTPVPISSAFECRRHRRRSAAAAWSSAGVDWEAGVKRRALADFALDLHAAAMRQDNGAGLKQPDTEPFLFRALKGPEQRVPDEGRTHSAAVVDHRQYDAIAALAGADLDAPSRTDRIASVHDQVGDHA